jgi:hypothetical protein
MHRLRTNPFIPAQDRLEIEIRGCSIWAVELLKRAMWQELRKEGRDFITEREPLNAVVIDFYLWNFAKKHAKELETIPIHKMVEGFSHDRTGPTRSSIKLRLFKLRLPGQESRKFLRGLTLNTLMPSVLEFLNL